GVLLGDLGDPRPGVCDLPPVLVELESGSFVIGITPEEAGPVRVLWRTYWREQGKTEDAEQEADYFTQNETNATPTAIELRAFAITRYPVTNAQYARFMADGGYDRDRAWWDAAGRAWLARDDQATEGLERWQRRTHKDRPEWWDNAQFGIA